MLADPPTAPASQGRTLGPVAATLGGWLAVLLYNLADVALLPRTPKGAAIRALHGLVEIGHVLFVAMAAAALVALFPRFQARAGVRAHWARPAGVALVAAALAPIVVAPDLEGAFIRLLPNAQSDWPLLLVSVGVAQALSVSFLAGRWCARHGLRWLGGLAGLSLIAANAFVLPNGYPGAHVLLSASGATLLAASLAGARLPRGAARLGRAGPRDAAATATRMSRMPRPATLAWTLVAALSLWSVVKPPPSGVQVELMARDTPLLFPWLRALYAPSRTAKVAIPRELRAAFEPRAGRPPIPPPAEPLLPEDPIVVLITIDALRFDVLEPRYRHAAPNLHEMRKSSVYFSQARSSGSDTRYSMASLFTGLNYSQLEWTRRRGHPLTLEHDDRPRFPELLEEAGVETAGVLTVTMLQPRQGIARGFGERLRIDKHETLRARSDGIATSIIERLREQGDAPLFVYTHLMEPHAPYETYGKPAASKFDAYLLEVSVADENIGRIRRAIAELGLKQRTALIVSADHGEGFGEHRIFTHGKAFYDVLVRVPLLIEVPGVAPRSVDDFVSLMDVGPTVLDLFGVATPGHYMAESLTPYLRGGRGAAGRLVLMEKATQRAMVFPDGLKLLDRRGAYELYDVRRDPHERNNLWDELGEEGPRRLALLEEYVRLHARRRSTDSDRDE